MTNVRITWQPATVVVNDDRGEIPGAEITSIVIDGRDVTTDYSDRMLIPPEGRPETWAGPDLWEAPEGVEDSTWFQALGDAAVSGADGHAGSTEESA